jgi:hypothetical protein
MLSVMALLISNGLFECLWLFGKYRFQGTSDHFFLCSRFSSALTAHLAAF